MVPSRVVSAHAIKVNKRAITRPIPKTMTNPLRRERIIIQASYKVRCIYKRLITMEELERMLNFDK
ncbi:MAG: hypothetical protein ACJ70N_07945, partial [Nitrososphaera sp.]